MVFFSDQTVFFFLNLCPSNNRSVPRTLGHREARACKQRLFIHGDLYEKILRSVSLVQRNVSKSFSPLGDISVRRIFGRGRQLFQFLQVPSCRSPLEDRCNFYEFKRRSFSDFLESIDRVTLITVMISAV